MASRGSALVDAQDASSSTLLISCKERPRQYTPPGGTYTVVRDSSEFLGVLRDPGSSSRLIRVSDAVRYLELMEPFVVPAGVTVTVDCQGAVLDFQQPSSVPGKGSELNLFSCCTLDYPLWPPYLSEKGVFSDSGLLGTCKVRFMGT